LFPAVKKNIMNISSLISKCKRHGIGIELSGDQIKVNAPKGQVVADILNEVRTYKNEIIQYLKSIVSAQYVPIPVATPKPYYATAHGQRRLWVLEQFGGLGSAYNIPLNWGIRGNVNADALEQAIYALMERHEILRTKIEVIEGEPYQKIQSVKETGFSMQRVDLQHLPDAEMKAKELSDQESTRPFDIMSSCMMRAMLITMEPTHHVLVLTVHHIISDGWSVEIMGRELLEHYKLRLAGIADSMPPLRIQYKDYAEWQAKELSGENMEEHRRYWFGQFSGEIPVLEFPADFPRPADKTYKGATAKVFRSRELAASLQKLARQHDSTMFILYQAALVTLLHRYTSQDDIIIGTPVAGREHPDLEDQLGFYVNTLAFRSRMTKDITFEQLLSQVKENTIEAFRHQVYPFDRLVEELVTNRDMSRSPLFDVLLIVEAETGRYAPANENKPEDMVVYQYDTNGEQSKFDMSVSFKEGEEGLEILVNYNPDLYTRVRMKQFARHLGQLLESIVKDPSQVIDRINYLDESEKQLLDKFSGGHLAYPDVNETIHGLVEAQAARTPGKTAVVYQDTSLTYDQVNRRSNKLAHYLIANGIGKGDLVGVMIDRNEHSIETFLGVMKSGAAYVPVDTSYPPVRKEFLISDAGMKLIITTDAQENLAVRSITSSAWLADSNLPDTNPEERCTGEDVAYIIYTSGSTGKPKGVMIEHRNAVSFLHWCREEFGQSRFDVMFAGSSYCFDLSVFEMFFPLSIGKSVRMLWNNLDIKQHLDDKNIFVNTVPSVVVELLRSGPDLSNINVLNMGGEPIPPYVIASLDMERMEVRNMYGPSEDTTFSTLYRLNGNEQDVPIGNPITNTRAYVLSPQMQVQPIGVYGEICLSGTGVGRGYLNRPEMSAERFIENPFEPGWRMYLTGDRGCWNRDGVLEFTGRKDNQWKIRGFRIEAGEIENAVRQYPSIKDGVVSVIRGVEDKELVCYFISPEKIDIDDLRRHLEQRIPAYMVPAHFMHLDTFPLNANGKLDRGQLPVPDVNQRPEQTFVAAETELEQYLTSVWEEVLGKNNIGVTDNFFSLGGYSLKAVRITSRILKEMNVKLSLKSIFVYPTIRELAREIENITWVNEAKVSLPGQETEEVFI
jgi:amino acid adenylation domain-containing protein